MFKNAKTILQKKTPIFGSRIDGNLSGSGITLIDKRQSQNPIGSRRQFDAFFDWEENGRRG